MLFMDQGAHVPKLISVLAYRRLSDFMFWVAMLELAGCNGSLPECVLLLQVFWACRMAHFCTLTS